MIAVALSGGIDSAAAAVSLHLSGENIFGMTMLMGNAIPDEDHINFASDVCKKLGVEYHVADIRKEFGAIKEYFCSSYLNSETPNPCAVCNRDIKFSLMLKIAMSFGADRIATGHYTALHHENGRYFLAATEWKNSQEYFMGLVSQESLSRAVFPLAGLGRPDAESLVAGLGLTIESRHSSQDVCFIPDGHVPFIQRETGCKPEPGPIVNLRGRRIGTHRGAISYTIGQRKGLVTAFGKKVYVLATDAALNTVTVGDLSDWPHKGFYLRDVNYQKISGIEGNINCIAKVRYKQSASPSTLRMEGERIWVEYPGLWAPGQLCVAYDATGAVLLAGIIEK